MPEIPDEVMNRAVEAVDNDPVAQGVSGWDDQVEAIIRTAAPVLVAAAIEAERERIRRVLTEVRDEPGAFDPDDDSDFGYRAGLNCALSVIDEEGNMWVRFSDVEEREARFQTRIEELEAGIRDVQNDLRQSRATLEDLRSLLDSGEEQICPDWSDAEIRAAIAAFRATEERS